MKHLVFVAMILSVLFSIYWRVIRPTGITITHGKIFTPTALAQRSK